MNECSIVRLSFDDALRIPAIGRILQLLESNLDARLIYHSAEHTRTVLADALMLATAEGCTVHEQNLLAWAAAFHDSGFLDQFSKNEPFGAKRAREAMKEAGHLESDIQAVEQLILDTEMVQSSAGFSHLPHHILSPYLLDADLANLGRPSFWQHLEQLAQEQGTETLSLAKQTIPLLEAHRWLTRTASQLWQRQARVNLEELTRRISAP
jgi:predicted metal-dependent HD superfamily phosphohydrolase